MSGASDRAPRVTAPAIRARKVSAGAAPITALTAYDYPTARLVDESGVDVILVGDSIGNVVLGYEGTIPVTLDEMIAASKAVVRGAPRALVVGDMPFGSYHVSVEQAVSSAVRFMKEGGVRAVKLEGGMERAAAIRAIVDAGIPVMAHIGLRPQAVHAMGGYRVQGKTGEGAAQLLADAESVADSGAFAVVIEGVPATVAATITARISIPTIGIGAGKDCDGQILVLHDVIGLTFGKSAKFVRRYADVGGVIRDAVQRYVGDVVEGTFPSDAETY